MGRNPVFLGRLYSFSATALGLLDLVYFCNVLSTGHLPSQVWQPCTHSVLHGLCLPYGVMLASTCYKSFLGLQHCSSDLRTV